MIVAMLVMLAAGVTLWLIPIRMHVQWRQHALQAVLHVEARAAFLKLDRSVNVGDKVAMAVEHMAKRWRATGEPVKIPLQKTIRRYPRKKLMRAVGRPIRFLGRRCRVERLNFTAELGGWDALESALLAGMVWSAVGAGLGWLSQFVLIDPRIPAVRVLPNFQRATVRIKVDCILRFGLGHAIVAGVWLLCRTLRERELLAWARDSWRRKGVEDDGRASDSGPDEDGHGESEGHG